ncbi:UvrD-helicase domain-containing protein [Polyangium mundeleinium]|uniref:DNA 3'-5' helicase n=1 Tax=Polyangium mundeleinium TaxID=2995306 RepID=A0ABT5EHB5_9BACT|nr:ATP-dependent helicase [Polyangium mundeleinium]MDC0740889.1 ATP-dependent helicase [Polyangium mundeleinium]
MARLVDPSAWTPRGIAELEPAAESAVRANENTAVVAGPGAGKTELLAQRACFLLETGTCPPPRRILAISFKRDAARNLRDRVHRRAGLDLGRRFDSYTFDAFAKSVLDQFLVALPREVRPTGDYEVVLSSPRAEDVGDILRRMTPPRDLGSSSDLEAFENEWFFKQRVLQVPLRVQPKNLEHWAAQEFWRQLLFAEARSRLYFGMITRLVIGLIRTDERVRRAYRTTYSHVFLDEFQDTTEPQYTLTRALFQGTAAILTAVGDPQQRINGWAGALPNAFKVFSADFGATTKRLERNRRASAEIAPVVRFLAARLREEADEAAASEIAALEGGGPPPEACGAYLFPNDTDEADWIAGEIAALIESGVPPRDICILARYHAARYTAATVDSLRRRGINARLEDALQDLLSEPVVTLLLLAFRALLGQHPGIAWAKLRDELASLHGLEGEEDVSALDRSLAGLRGTLRSFAPTLPPTADAIRALVAEHIEPLFIRALRNRYAQYQRGSFYEQTVSKLSAELSKIGTGGWEDAIALVEGAGAVPIMTIHKSKGLEYSAVFFIGLEDAAFWSFRLSRSQAVEELNAFFVAISRAKKRVAFSFAGRRTLERGIKKQSRDQIAEVYELLTAASVPVTDMGSP